MYKTKGRVEAKITGIARGFWRDVKCVSVGGACVCEVTVPWTLDLHCAVASCGSPVTILQTVSLYLVMGRLGLRSYKSRYQYQTTNQATLGTSLDYVRLRASHVIS